MSQQHILHGSTEQSYEHLEALLGTASAMERTPGEPRKGYERTDTFLAALCKHLNAVDEVLVPAVRKHVPDGAKLAADYRRTAHRLEVALAAAKAREYGSVHAAGRSWPLLWEELRADLQEQHRKERTLAERLDENLEEHAAAQLADRLHEVEVRAPSRAHPYVPHQGVRGSIARRVLHAVDAFWDTAEGRIVPTPPRPPHREPGRLAQYILADPRFPTE